jgi:drug/metabolite transporter (DMT)-like permease
VLSYSVKPQSNVISPKPVTAIAPISNVPIPNAPISNVPSPNAPIQNARSPELEGTLMAALGILAFSFTLPLSRIAIPELGGTFVGLGRALVATILAMIVLRVRGERLPERRYWIPLLVTALGVVVGFPLLSSLALQSVPSIHGVVIVGLLPAMTAALGVLRTRERTTPLFWFAVALGIVGILVFAVIEGAGQPQPADALLLGAGLLGAVGYVEGGRLSRELEGWRVISWALVFSSPFLIVPVLLNWPAHPELVSLPAWSSFAYVSAISMYFAFFAWYRGLTLAGIARSSQLQLFQPILSITWAALILHEPIHWQTIFAAVIVLSSILLSRMARHQ